MNIEIDKLIPCLERTDTKEIVDTAYSLAAKDELKGLKEWKFKWSSTTLRGCEIFKLTVKDDSQIQGLVALRDVPEDKAVYVQIAESAPHNMGKQKKYSGVGGHLFAIAALRSFELGYDGFLYMDAKNTRLVQHYSKMLGATFLGTPHPYRMIVDENAASRLIKIYTLRRDSDV